MRKLICLLSFAAACATSASQQSTAADHKLIHQDYDGASLTAARALTKHPNDPWLLYEEGAAEASAGRLYIALPELTLAELRFTNPHDRGMAVYRRALALEAAGRCVEADRELARYAMLVSDEDPDVMTQVKLHAEHCVPPGSQQATERVEVVRLHDEPAGQVHRAEKDSTEAAAALSMGAAETAVAKADDGLKIMPSDPWLVYEKGAAMADLKRTEESLALLQQAESLFSQSNVHGRAVATYRRALVLEASGRCAEESAELAHYVEITNEPNFQREAASHLKFCKRSREATH